MAEFAPGAYWRPLVHNETPVPEPDNELFTHARAPTVPAEDAEADHLSKFNFTETFDRPPYLDCQCLQGIHILDGPAQYPQVKEINSL